MQISDDNILSKFTKNIKGSYNIINKMSGNAIRLYNIIISDYMLYNNKEFALMNKQLKEISVKMGNVSISYIKNLITEMRKYRVIYTLNTRGYYKVNPFLAWKGDIKYKLEEERIFYQKFNK